MKCLILYEQKKREKKNTKNPKKTVNLYTNHISRIHCNNDEIYAVVITINKWLVFPLKTIIFFCLMVCIDIRILIIRIKTKAVVAIKKQAVSLFRMFGVLP